ncbi:MAG: glycoside hydrolase family 95 protein, partial [Ginsengibacter sp.]
MKKGLLAFWLLTAIICHAQNKEALKLWYNQPSFNIWENALPIGNGRLGAMIYGNVDTERIQLNEHTLWSGSPNRNDNPGSLDSLAEIRKLIFDGKQKEAEQLANRIILTKQSHGQMFEPLGELKLTFSNADNYSNYHRELDISKAISTTNYTVNDITYTRQTLASFPDRVVVMCLTANKPHGISFTAFYTTLQPNAHIKTTAVKQLTIAGTTIDHEGVKGMVQFKGITQFKTEGGSISSTDTSIIIKDADAVTIYISIATNFKNYHDISGNENERAQTYLTKAYNKSFATILKEQVAAYQKYFNRVHLDLGVTDAAKLPTDERLKNFNTTNDPQLVTLYYQYGRYLLISSSQAGGQPANLQGIWNNQLYPPWDSKYTINI